MIHLPWTRRQNDRFVTSVQIPRARTRDRTIVDRLLARFPLIALIFAIVIFYAVEAWMRKMPWDFTDELEWTQISRSIAATGHAARRGQPIGFKSLYAFVIAPFWWIHSTATAYAAIKYANALIMSLAAIPTYLLARMLVTRRSAVAVAVLSIAIPAMGYATFILPEALFYPYFATCSWLAVRALRSGKKLDAGLAVLVVLGAYLVKQAEFTTLPVAFGLAAAGLWISGPRGKTMRRNWTRGDTIGALALLLGAFYLFNRVVLQHVQEWQTTTQYDKHRMLDLGLQAGLSFTIGLGVLPVVGGLASLRLPDRKGDPVYRAFAAWLGATVFAASIYAAMKSAYLSTQFGTYVAERNLVYLSPLLLLGTALVFESRRIDWRLVSAAAAFVAFIVLDKPFQFAFPYIDAPGFSIPAALSVYWHWKVGADRFGLVLVLIFSLLALAGRRRRIVTAAAGGFLLAWLLAGEIAFTDGVDRYANQFKGNLPTPYNWVDLADHGQPAAYLGQELTDQNGENLTEFWNRSIDHVDALDDTAPGPGPKAKVTLLSPTGLLTDYQGDKYVVADLGVHLDAPLVRTMVTPRGTITLYRLDGPWRLLDAEEGVYPDGANWCGSFCAYTYFKPGQKGTLKIDLGRLAYNGSAAAGKAQIKVGGVVIDDQQEPQLNSVDAIRNTLVENGMSQTIDIPVAHTPVRVEISIPNTFPDPNGGRQDGAQVLFTFVPAKPGR